MNTLMINLNYIKIYKQDNEFIITNGKPYADTFNKIDLSYFPLNFFNDVNSETIILYRHYTGNPDIPYIQKILKRKNELPEIWYNEKSLNSELFHINYSIEEKKYLDEILINICYG